MSKLVIFTMLALTVASGEASAQAARVPVALRLTLNGAEARLGARVPSTSACGTTRAKPSTATERLDVVFESSLPATFERVTIPLGKDSASTVIVFQRAGIAKLKATSGKLSPGYGVISITHQAVATAPAPTAGYAWLPSASRRQSPPATD